MPAIEVKVPDIGDFKDVPVIEVLVKPGDSVKKDDSLITLESDKATMEVPSTHSGTVKEVKVKVGDKVAQGTLIAILETASLSELGDHLLLRLPDGSLPLSGNAPLVTPTRPAQPAGRTLQRTAQGKARTAPTGEVGTARALALAHRRH